MFLLLFAPAIVGGITAPNAQVIVQKSVEATQHDWQRAPEFSFVDHEIASKRGYAETPKTYRVLMIEGSPYNELLAVNGVPLTAQQRQVEQEKLEREIYKRKHESAAERNRRMSAYLHDRDHDHEMLTEMTKAFQYSLTGEATLNGHKVWVLKATPNPGYVPHNREGKVLRHMAGNMWVDQATYQWVKVEAQVTTPVSMYGFLARVYPGTKFELEQSPAAGDVWLPKRFAVTVKAIALGIRNEDSYDEDDYSDYRPQPATVAAK